MSNHLFLDQCGETRCRGFVDYLRHLSHFVLIDLC